MTDLLNKVIARLTLGGFAGAFVAQFVKSNTIVLMASATACGLSASGQISPPILANNFCGFEDLKRAPSTHDALPERCLAFGNYPNTGYRLKLSP